LQNQVQIPALKLSIYVKLEKRKVGLKLRKVKDIKIEKE